MRHTNGKEKKHNNICGIWMAQKENTSEIMAISEALVESGGLARFRAGRVAALTCHRQVIHSRSHRVRRYNCQNKRPPIWVVFCFGGAKSFKSELKAASISFKVSVSVPSL